MNTSDLFLLRPDEVPSPALLVYPDRIRENIRRMVSIAGGDPGRLRPHVKTHKLSQVIQLKRDAGIRRFKCATIAECEMTAAAGGEDILLSYPLVGPNIRRWLALQRMFPNTRFAAVVDDPAMAHELSVAATRDTARVEVFLDVNVGMNRTGITPGPAAAALYALIHRLPGIECGGFHVYDGHLHQPDRAERRARWAESVEPVWKLRQQLLADGYPIPRIVAGGTPTFPFFAELPEIECSPGTTVLWDFGQPVHNPDLDFLNAAILITRVVSRPSGHRLCLDLGHKAVAPENPHPRVRLIGLEDAGCISQSEEHLVIETSRADEFPVGHVFYGIPRHICPTVALHNEVYVVEDRSVTTTWPVSARSRRISV